MKRIGFFAAIGIFIFVSCKREKIEAVGPKEKNDTTVTNPLYWCVKSAVLRKFGNYVSFKFEYDNKSLLKVAKVYKINPDNKDTIESTIHTYNYEGDKLIYRKSISNDSIIQEEFIKYYAGKIKTIEIKGYNFYSSKSNGYSTYEYEGKTVKTTTTYFSGFGQKEDTIFTTFKDYPDSSIAETRYIWTDIRPEPTYVFKEKFLKSTNAILLIQPEGSDSVSLGAKQNLINPLIWELFDLDYYFASYTSYKIKSILISRANNSYFYENLFYNSDISKKYPRNYTYDNSGRLTILIQGPPLVFIEDEGLPVNPIELNLTY